MRLNLGETSGRVRLRYRFAIEDRGIVMPSLSLRGIPEDVYEGLRQLAAWNHRSMQEQARLMIERDVRLSRPTAVEAPRQWRERLKGRQFPELVSDLRADRVR